MSILEKLFGNRNGNEEDRRTRSNVSAPVKSAEDLAKEAMQIEMQKQEAKKRELKSIFADAPTSLSYQDPAEFVKVNYHFAVSCSAVPGQAFACFENAIVSGVYYIPAKVFPKEISYGTGHSKTLFVKIKDIQNAGATLEEVVDEINNSNKEDSIPTARGTNGSKWGFEDISSNICCSKGQVYFNVMASDTKNEIFAYEARRRIDKIKDDCKEDGVYANLEGLSQYYEKIGKPEIAKKLLQHKMNLVQNENSIDATAPLTLNFEDQEFTKKAFPREYAELVNVQKQIENIVAARNAEVLNMRLMYRRDTLATSKKAIEEIDTTAKNRLALTEKTFQPMIDTIFAKYDPQLLELCKRRYEIEIPILKIYELGKTISEKETKYSWKDKRSWEERASLRNITQDEYKALHGAGRSYRRPNESKVSID